MIKKIVLIALTIVLIAGNRGVSQEKTKAAQMPLRVTKNGHSIEFPDALPFIDENGRTQAPVRFISQKMSATDIRWYEETQTVYISARTASGIRHTVEFVIGSREYRVNGKKKEMDTEAMLINDRTYVPVRYVADGLGGTVEWNEEDRVVDITYNGTTDETVNAEEWEENLYGFNVKYNTGSGLNIVLGNYDYDYGYELKDRLRRDLFSIRLERITWFDYEMELEETDAIIHQNIEESVADEVMTYVRQKTNRHVILEEKEFYDDTYKITVSSGDSHVVYIYVYYK